MGTKTLTNEEFERLTHGVPFYKDGKVREACRLILVDGYTWRKAQAACGVEPSSILQAMRRINTRAPTYEGVLRDRRALLTLLRTLVQRIEEHGSTRISARDPLVVRAKRLTTEMEDH